uniref:Uncharacterized protein n=1 Tax=Moniliophthora roreri TaxID=221103 RepID=A0A0W0FPZ9_MONRR
MSSTVYQVVLDPIVTVSTTLFLYGLHTVLFGICIHILRHRRGDDHKNRRLYIVLTAVMFVLTTILNGFTTTHAIRWAVKQLEGRTEIEEWDIVWSRDLISHSHVSGLFGPLLGAAYLKTRRAAADTMLAHRCYLVWGSRKSILITITLALVTINVYGLAQAIFIAVCGARCSSDACTLWTVADHINHGFWAANAMVNLGLTVLTGATFSRVGEKLLHLPALMKSAGRIWKITYQSQSLGLLSSIRYKTIITIVLESGIMYPMILMVYILLSHLVMRIPYLWPVVYQTAGIAPMLIIIRSAMKGKAEDSTTELGLEVQQTLVNSRT